MQHYPNDGEVLLHRSSDETTLPHDGRAMSMFTTNRRALVISVSHGLFPDGKLAPGTAAQGVKDVLYDLISEAMSGEPEAGVILGDRAGA